MTKEVRDYLKELICSYGAEFRCLHEIENMTKMSAAQIYAEYEYVFSKLWSKQKLHIISQDHGTRVSQEESKELIWEEFFSARYQNVQFHLYSDRDSIDDEDDADWEELRVRRPVTCKWVEDEWYL